MIQAVNTASNEPSPETSYHQGLEVLHSVVLYWTACTVLYSTMRIMFQWFPGLHFDGSVSVQPARTDPQKYALYIMRSVKYFLQPEAGLHGAQNISLPLGVALNYLAAVNKTPTGEYSSLVQLIHETTKTPAGSWIGSFLTGLQRNSVPKTVQTVFRHTRKSTDMVRIKLDTTIISDPGVSSKYPDFTRRHLPLRQCSRKGRTCEISTQPSTRRDKEKITHWIAASLACLPFAKSRQVNRTLI
jgi:hypothetical protein